MKNIKTVKIVGDTIITTEKRGVFAKTITYDFTNLHKNNAIRVAEKERKRLERLQKEAADKEKADKLIALLTGVLGKSAFDKEFAERMICKRKGIKYISEKEKAETIHIPITIVQGK